MNILRASRVKTLLALVVVAAMRTTSAHGQSLTDVLTNFRSAEYSTRSTGFYRLLALALDDSTQGLPRNQRFAAYLHDHPDVGPALIALLERENLPDSNKASIGDDPYYGDLIGVVASLRDPRAVNALLGSIDTGAFATNGLVQLGQSAVPGLLLMIRSQQRHFFARSAAVGVLHQIIKEQTGLKSAEVRSALLSALKDPSHYVRRNAAYALGEFSGPDIRKAMVALASQDPAVNERSGKQVFPVRDAALAWIRKDDAAKGHAPSP